MHGWDASPENHWFLKAKENWSKLGWEVIVPELPGGYYPKKEEWTEALNHLGPDDKTILIGHSLGGVAILNYLSQNVPAVGQAILIATPYEPMKFTPIATFFPAEFDWGKIRKNCPNFDLIYETDDPLVPNEHGQRFAQKLSGKFHEVPGGVHFHSIDIDFLKGLVK